MRQIAVVVLTIAGLVACPGVCWVHAFGDCASGGWLQAARSQSVADAAGRGCCGCCAGGPARSPSETPQPARPSDKPGGSCICKGATVASKSDAPLQHSAGALLGWLLGAEATLQAPAVADRGAEIFHPLAHAPPTGRALRILLQSFLI